MSWVSDSLSEWGPVVVGQSVLGLAGTNGNVFTGTDNTVFYFNSSCDFYVFETLSQIRVILSNFVWDTRLGESTAGGARTGTCGLEWPLGTFTQVTFGGSPSVTIGDVGIAMSDWIVPATPLVPGQTARIKQWGNSPAGVSTNLFGSTPATTNIAETSASVLPDKTLTTTAIVNQGHAVPPLAILGMVTRPSFVVIGDSIVEGYVAQKPDALNNLSPPCLGLGPFFAWTKFAIGGLPMSRVILPGFNKTFLQQILGYATCFINQLGVNDYTNGDTHQTMLANSQTILSMSAGNKYQGTITPRTNGANTALAFPAQDPERVAFNQSLRAGQSYLTNFFDPAAQVEVANTGFWTNSNLTVDGVHPTNLGAQTMALGWPQSEIH